MALVGINPTSSEPRKPSTLENIALGFSIANNAIGAGVAIPKLIMDMGIAKEQKKSSQYDSAKKFSETYSPSSEGVEGAVKIKAPLEKEERWYTPKEDASDFLSKLKMKSAVDDETTLTKEELDSIRVLPQYRNVTDSLLPKTRGDFKEDKQKVMVSQGDVNSENEAVRRERRFREHLDRMTSNDKSMFLERQANAFKADPAYKKAIAIRESSDEILSITDMSLSNPIAAASIPTFMSRASGEVGALTEPDKKPFAGTRDLVGRINQAYEQWTKGTLTPENQAFVKQLAVAFKNHAERSRMKLGKEFIKSRLGLRKDVTEQELSDAVLGGVIPEQTQFLTEEDTTF